MRSNSFKNVGQKISSGNITNMSENPTLKIHKMKEKVISGESYEKSATSKSSVG